MDKYVITIVEIDLSPLFNDESAFLNNSRNNEIEISSPYVEWLLQTRKGENYNISLRLSLQNDENSPRSKCYDWNTDEDADKTVHGVTYKKAAEVLLLLAEELPVPGSYLMDILWFTHNVGRSEILQNVSPLLGALKKLCEWHRAQLHVFIDGEIEKRTLSALDFVTQHAKVIQYNKEESILPNEDGVVWRGNLDILSKGVPTNSIPKFFMILDNKEEQPQISVRFAKENEGENDAVSSKNNLEQVWFGPRLSVLQFIDISTIPLYLFSGKRFLLRYTFEDNLTEDWNFVKHLQDVFDSDTLGAFLCSMDYAISNNGFDNIPEYSTKNWQQAVLKTPHDLKAPKYRFHHGTRLLHLIVCQSGEDKLLTEWNGHKIIQFSAIILHPLEDINATPSSHADMRKSFYSAAREDCDCTALESVENLPEINLDGLLYKDKKFNQYLCAGLKQWSDSHKTTMIPYSELKNLVLNTSQHLNQTQEQKLFSSVNNTTNSSVNNVKRPSNNQILSCEKLHDLQLQALRNRESFLQDPESKLRKINTADSLRAVAKTSIDMHFDVADIINCFERNQSSTEYLDNVAAWQTKPSLLSPRKLTDFGEAIKISHCGLMYNIDERLAEKQDRMCRRMVEKLVKFETTSLGSSEKIPSPATMNIADSPFKRSSLCAGSSKQKQLQKVAAKLYKKRIHSREVRSSISRPTTSMILRSTPTKSKNNLLRRNSTICLRSSTSENRDHRLLKTRTQSECVPKEKLGDEERISKRRSHVQDNKKRLQELVTHALTENGILRTDKKFNSCAKRLYNVSIAFLRDLKTSKNLEKIMKQTVLDNVQSVISFKEK